jgi:hypothetical protein
MRGEERAMPLLTKRRFPFLVLPAVCGAALMLALAGCSSLEMPGSAKYFSNQPGGMPFFKVASGLGGPTLAVQKGDGTWTKPRPMKPIGQNEPPLSTTPGLSKLVENAHRVDDYVFLEFTPTAKLHGQPVPSHYFLLPGGFAYPVEPAKR